MRSEVIREIEAGDPCLEVPWTSPNRRAQGYVDLKHRPDDLAALEECRRYPALGELLRAVNAPESGLRTAKCDVWVTRQMTEDERLDFNLPWKAASYVDILFESPRRFSSFKACQRLANTVQRLVRPLRFVAQLEIMLRRATLHHQERRGFYLTLYPHAYGSRSERAVLEWEKAVGSLARIFSRASRLLPRDLPAAAGRRR